MVPLTRGSTTMLRPVIKPRVRATPSISALLKFKVMGSPGLAGRVVPVELLAVAVAAAPACACAGRQATGAMVINKVSKGTGHEKPDTRLFKTGVRCTENKG